MTVDHSSSLRDDKSVDYKHFITNYRKSKYGKRSFRVFAKASFVLALHALSLYRIKSVVYGFEFRKKIGESFIFKLYRYTPICFCN